MGLEALLEISGQRAPTHDEFRAHADVDFYERLVSKKKKTSTEAAVLSYFHQYVQSEEFDGRSCYDHILTQINEYNKKRGEEEQIVVDLRDIVGAKDGQNTSFNNCSHGLGNALGLWTGTKANQDVRGKLVQHGILEGRLANIEHADDIITAMFEDCKSVAVDYLNPAVVGEEIAQENRESVRKSQALQTYLRKIAVKDLRDVVTRKDGQYTPFGNCSYGLGKALGLWTGKKANQDVRGKLVQHGILEGRLAHIDHADEIITAMFEDRQSVAVDYVNPDVVGEEIAQENRNYVYNSIALQTFLRKIGVKDLRDITAAKDGQHTSFNNCSLGLGKALGLWTGMRANAKVRQQLVQHGILEGRLSHIDHADEIITAMFEDRKSVAVDYVNPDVVGEKVAQENRDYLLASEYFQDILKEKNIAIEDVHTHFPTLFPTAIVDTRQEGLDTIVGSRMLQHEWTAEETEALDVMIAELGYDNFLMRLHEDSEQFTERFGVGVSAIESKAYRLVHGQAVPAVSKGGKANIVYAFPPIHDTLMRTLGGNEAQAEKDITYLHNIATTFEQDLMPEIVPVFGFYSAAQNEQEQPEFVHITTPIFYKGTSLDDYLPAEQQALQTLAKHIGVQRPVQLLQRSIDENKTIVELFERTRFLASHPALDTRELTYAPKKTLWLWTPDQQVTYKNTAPTMIAREIIA